MPYDLLARALASMDLPLPDALSSGAPHYTLPPHQDRRDDIDGLTLAQAQAVALGAVTMPRTVHMKANG